MMRLAAIEEKQGTLMGEVATFEETYQDDLDAANAAIADIVDNVYQKYLNFLYYFVKPNGFKLK